MARLQQDKDEEAQQDLDMALKLDLTLKAWLERSVNEVKEYRKNTPKP